MKRRILALVLTLCMLLSLVPMSALAVDTYGLYINEFRFTSSNLTYTGETGNAVYNPSTKTLTLNNLTISTKSVNTLIYSEIDGLNIQINGTLTINLLDSKPINGDNAATALPNYGFALNANTTIRGTNNSADKDCIIINSASVGVAQQEFEDGTTRVGIATGGGASLTMENITVRMTDNSTGSYAGHASMIRAKNALNISGCKLVADKCQFGIFMDDYVPATISNTAFAMNLSGTDTSGVTFAPNTVNVLQNCSGSISATYPIYTAGQLTISGSSKLTLVADKMGVVATQNDSNPSGEVIFDNANVEIQSENKGLQVEEGGSITMKSGTVTVTEAAYGVQVLEGSSFAMQGGTLSLRGKADTSSVGVDNYGIMTVTGGSLNVENVYTAIQNSSNALSVTGGEHTLTAATCGYLGDTASELQIANTAKVTINAEVGIQLPAQSSSKLTVSGGELNLNTTDTGINLEDSTSTMTLSGGKVNVTDKNSTPTIYGMYCRGNTQLTGAEVTFNNCRYDLLVANSASKMTGGKLHLSGNYFGAQLSLGFEMTGGVIDGSTGAFGFVVTQGTTSFKGGTVDLIADYPFYLTKGATVDFAGANVTGESTSNCGLYVDSETEGNSYKISGGTVVLTSTQAGANEMYTSIPSNYGVWAGTDEASATLVANPTKNTLITNKYVRFAEKKAHTLTLVNVKEGTSASYLPGASFTYTAKDAPNDQHFSHWALTVNGSTTNVGTGTTYSGKMPSNDATLTAVFDYCSGGTATCQKKPICSVCGKEYGILAAHKLTEEVEDEKYVITPATCESEGTYYKSCSVCGASAENWNNATFTVPALGHDWSDWASNGDGTHSRICGNDADHTEKEDCSGGTADCTHGPICDFCHAEYGKPGDHNYTAEVAEAKYLKTEATCTEAAVYYKSCTGCGASSEGTEFEATFSHGEPLRHQWGAWTSDGKDTHSRICGRDANHKETVKHDFSAEVAESQYLKAAATCTEAAVYYKSCSVCGESSEGSSSEATFTYGESLKHDWSDWTSTGKDTHSRTCKRDPSHIQTENCSGGTADCTHGPICDTCHAEYGTPLGHKFNAEVAEPQYLRSEATETEAATYYKSCSVCGASSEGTEFEATFSHGEAKGHDWSDWASNGDGTHSRICGNDADHTEKEDCSGGTADCTHGPICTVCHAEYDSPAGHSYTQTAPQPQYLKTEATCTNAPIYYKSCSGCGASSKGTEFEATFSFGRPLGHKYEWIVDKEATETEAGSKHEECTVCHDKKDSVEIPATGLVRDTEELKTLLDAGGTVKLEKDYTIISALNVNCNVILDLNGHTITSLCTETAYRALYVGGGHSLTLTDSSAGKTGRLTNAGTVHTGIYVSGGSFVMAGGTIDGFLFDVEVHDSSTFTMTGGTLTGAAGGLALFMAGGAGSNFALRPTMYADGGAVDGNADFYNCTVTKSQGAADETVFNGKVTITGCWDKKVTIRCGVFCGAVDNGGEIAGGIFYGGLTHIVDPENYDSNGRLGENAHTITFMDGETQHAIEVLDSGVASYAPVAPTKTNCTFDGWYNGDTKYIFGSAITEDLTLNARWSVNQYTITFDTAGGSEINPITQDFGTDVTAPEAPTKAGYTFAGWDPEIPATMPAEDMTITAKWTKNSSGGGSSAPSYSISIPSKTDGGKVSVSPKSPKKGDTVTITPKSEAGYTVEQVLVTDKNGDPVEVTNNGDGTYSFQQPSGKVEVTVTFVEVTVQDNRIVLTLGSPVATVSGEQVTNDVAPIARNNRTLLPIRFIAEALGATVDWNADLQKATVKQGELLIEIYLGQSTAYVNGNPIALDVAAFAENNRTYLPLRFVAESLGAEVLWDQATQSITIIPA